MTHSSAVPDLDAAGLRRFGLLIGGIVGLVFGLVIPWLGDRPFRWWPWSIFAVLTGLAVVAPLLLRPIYRGWMRFGLLASKVTTPLILGLVFFLMITPIAALRRIRGQDSLRKNLDRTSTGTYRLPSEAHSTTRLERPF